MSTSSRTGKRQAPQGDFGITAIYARISKDWRGDEAGVGRQLDDCRALAARNGWATKEFVDNDISASKYTRKRRPRYREMLERVRAGEISRIVCAHMDRLYRQPKELEELIDLVDDGAVSVVSVYSGTLDLSNSDGVAMARVMVAFAAKGSDDTSRRELSHQASLRAQGVPAGGRRAFGWADKMTPDPVEAAIVAEGMAQVLAGDPLSEVARSWNRRGVKPVKAAHWTASSVRCVLTNPRHAAQVHHQGVVVRDAVWPEIVDRATLERVTQLLDARGSGRSVPHRAGMLTGLVMCGRCGLALQTGRAAKPKRGGSAPPILVCSHRPDPTGTGHVGCGLSVRAWRVETMAVEATFAHVDGLELADVVADQPDSDSQSLIELAQVEARQAELGKLYAAGTLNARAFTSASVELDQTSTALRKQIAARSVSVLAAYAGPGVLAAAWPDLPTSRRRAVIAAALEQITVLPHTVGPKAIFDPGRVVFGKPPRKRKSANKHS